MITFTVPVAGGTGSFNVPADSFGKIAMTCINPPAATTPTYSYSATDIDGYGLAGLSNLPAGSNTIVERYTFITGGVFMIYGANVDGNYTVRLYESTDIR